MRLFQKLNEPTRVSRSFSPLHSRFLALWQQLRLRPALWQTGFLTGIDGLTNLVDYSFHIYLARVLLPADFAVVQTINTAVLLLVTAFAVLQPVVARFTSTAIANQQASSIQRGIFQFYFWRSLMVAFPLMLIVIWARQPIATWLNVPPATIFILALILLLSIIRPVIAGQLQGQGKFIAFGLTRFSNALSRLGVAVLLITVLDGGLLTAVSTLPIGGFIALLVGLAALGWHIWKPPPPLPPQYRQATRLLIGTFLAFAAYMSLLSMDLIWVNRLFAPNIAGEYATAVLLRRVLSLIPTAVIVVMYPRVVAQVAQGQLPDKLLAQTATIVLLPTLLLTAVYTQFGALIIRWTFGSDYIAAAPLLLGMGLGMVGFGLTAVWLNLYLATRPLPFVALLIATALTQITLFNQFHNSLTNILFTFALSGWITAIGGFSIYVIWLRPLLQTEPFQSPKKHQ